MRIHFGTRQDDVPALVSAITQDFAGEQIDVILDDASHQYNENSHDAGNSVAVTSATAESTSSKTGLGGTIRTGRRSMWVNQPLMSPLLSELMLVCGRGRGVIDRIDIDPNFAVIWRGPAPLPTDGTFRLTDDYVSRDFQVALPSSRRHLRQSRRAKGAHFKKFAISARPNRWLFSG